MAGFGSGLLRRCGRAVPLTSFRWVGSGRVAHRTKVSARLTPKSIVEAVAAKPGEPVWRETGDGHAGTLMATEAAFTALGNGADQAPHGAAVVDNAAAPADTAPDSEPL